MNIMKSTNATLDYVVNLHKKNSASLGFIPYPRIKQYIDNNQVFIEDDGGDNAGYIVVGNGKKDNILRVYQACVEQDLRRLTLGKKLFQKVIGFGKKNDCDSVLLRCRENLQSNLFWKALGCDFLHLDRKQTQRTKKGVNVWRYKLQDSRQFELL